jgi:hypothetical protein
MKKNRSGRLFTPRNSLTIVQCATPNNSYITSRYDRPRRKASSCFCQHYSPKAPTISTSKAVLIAWIFRIAEGRRETQNKCSPWSVRNRPLSSIATSRRDGRRTEAALTSSGKSPNSVDPDCCASTVPSSFITNSSNNLHNKTRESVSDKGFRPFRRRYSELGGSAVHASKEGFQPNKMVPVPIPCALNSAENMTKQGHPSRARNLLLGFFNLPGRANSPHSEDEHHGPD